MVKLLGRPNPGVDSGNIWAVDKMLDIHPSAYNIE